MDFKQQLERLPTIDHLQGLNIIDSQGALIHHIPAIAGKLGSLRVYHALALEFQGQLNRAAAEKGLQLFAEHTQDAQTNPGKHPNIDLLFQVVEQDLGYRVVLLET